METARKQSIANVKEFAKLWSWEVVTVQGDRLGTEKSRDVVMSMLGMPTDVLILLFVWLMLISVDERWFRMHVIDALRSVTDRYVGQTLDEAYIELLGVPNERYGACEVVEYCRVVESSKECRRCIEDYCYIHYAQVQM